VDTIYYTEIDNSKIVPKYLYHFIKTIDLMALDTGSGRPSLTQAILNRISIPIPCPDDPKRSLAIQGEIVRILDAFTSLTAELTAELTARKKQYNYYRDRLLTFDEGDVEYKTLSEVALEFGRGKSKHRPRNDSKLYGGNYPFIQTGDIRNASHVITEYTQTYNDSGLKQSKLWPKGTLCITIAANIAETSILGFDACFPDSVIGFVENPKKSNAQYVEYLISSLKSNLQAEGKKNSSAQANINLATFEKTRFPFPSVHEQQRIVNTLDKFETLTNSISEGLPREIELRQKQYEYYRDLLLNFPKAEEKKYA
jgi:type I restriction enzyme S subunit